MNCRPSKHVCRPWTDDRSRFQFRDWLKHGKRGPIDLNRNEVMPPPITHSPHLSARLHHSWLRGLAVHPVVHRYTVLSGSGTTLPVGCSANRVGSMHPEILNFLFVRYTCPVQKCAKNYSIEVLTRSLHEPAYPFEETGSHHSATSWRRGTVSSSGPSRSTQSLVRRLLPMNDTLRTP